jgi:GNAT superfamily N-acetyltransferase
VQVEPRYEVLFYVGDTLVGGASLTLDRDPHVGECANVVWQYVLPAYRNRGISRSVLRQARRLAVLSGVSTYSYTHRTGDYSYSIRYRRVR